MFDFETTVSGIEFKVRQLADEVQRLRDEAAAGRRRIGELEEALKDREITINNLKEENKVIKLGNRLNEGDDSAELKLKITQMIRTIDKSLEALKTME
ncbi:MAG: hypothetical protein IJ760_01460 [Bacteroidales bacterium]|nr:hypothetical protein [Bacteroidales bacterium]